MSFLKKKDIFKLMSSLDNIRYTSDITNIYDQRSFSIYLNSIKDIDYKIQAFAWGYRIRVSKTDGGIYESEETLYRKRFAPIMVFKIKKIVKEYENRKRIKRLERIASDMEGGLN